MKIYFVRHGQTDWNKEMIIQGRVDNPLNDIGLKQAHESAEYLKNIPFDLIVSSSLSRASETAKIIRDYNSYDRGILEDDRFIERKFGSACGKPIETHYHLVMDNLIDDMESDQDIVKRVREGMDDLSRQPLENILVACHSHVIKAALIGVEPDRFNFRTKLSNASTSIIEYDGTTYHIIEYNINDHISIK